jgi:hypothetical protein
MCSTSFEFFWEDDCGLLDLALAFLDDCLLANFLMFFFRACAFLAAFFVIEQLTNDIVVCNIFRMALVACQQMMK